MKYSPWNFDIIIFIYVYFPSLKIVCPVISFCYSRGVIFRVPISNISALSTKRPLIEQVKNFSNNFVHSLSGDRSSTRSVSSPRIMTIPGQVLSVHMIIC